MGTKPFGQVKIMLIRLEINFLRQECEENKLKIRSSFNFQVGPIDERETIISIPPTYWVTTHTH